MSYIKGHYHAFKIGGECFLFDTFHYITLLVKEEFQTTFLKYANNELIEDENQVYLDTLKRLEENGFFFSDDYFDIENDLTTKGIASLSFAPIYQCNFRCKYCFAEKRDSYNIVSRAFDKNTVINTLYWFTKKHIPIVKAIV